MANQEPLIRNAQTGRYLSRFESMTKRANLAVAQHGLDADEQKLLEIEHLHVGMDSKIVQSYIMPMTKLLHDWHGNAAELRKIVPDIQQLNLMAQKDDPILTATEKKRIDGYAKFLITFIQKKTALLTRVTSHLKNVVKGAASGVRDNTSDKLMQSSNFLVQAAGKILASKRESRESAQKDRLETRANILNQLSKFRADTVSPTRSFSDFDFDEDAAPKREPTPKPKHVPQPKKTVAASTIAGDMDELLTVDRAILHQVTITNQLLRTGGELSEQTKEAQERAANEGKPTSGAPTSKVVREKSPTPEKGLFDGAFGKFAKILGEFDLAKLIAPMIMPAVEALGSAFLVAGAGVAGWEIGKWLDGLTGHAMSNAVQKFAEGFNPNIKAQPKAAEQDEINLAQRRTHKTPTTLAEARKLNEDYVKNPATRQYDDMGKSLSPVAPKQVGANVEKVPVAPPVTASSDDAPVKAAPAELHVSEAGIKALKSREGIRKEPYWDVNGWSIGFGDHEYHGMPLGNDKSKKPNVRLTDSEADSMLRTRLKTHYEPLVRKNLGSKVVSQQEFDALVSVSYNSEAAGARLARRTAAGEKLTKNDFLASGTVHGQKNDVLQKRRGAEYAQFVSGPSPARSAAPVVSLTAQTQERPTTGGTTIVAPSTVASQNNGGGQSAFPIPITADNPETTARAIRSANAI